MLDRPSGRIPSLLAQVSIARFRLRGTLSVRAEIRRDKRPKILLPYSFRLLVVTDPLSRLTGRDDFCHGLLTSKERSDGGKRR